MQHLGDRLQGSFVEQVCAGAPPFGAKEPVILSWCENYDFIL
jgi:hypothetical protein